MAKRKNIVLGTTFFVIVVFGIAILNITRSYFIIPYNAPLMGSQSPSARAVVKILSTIEKEKLTRGEIITYEIFADDSSGRSPGIYISRIVGLPNEKISMQDSRLFVNNSEIVESYLNRGLGSRKVNFDQIEVPSDSYFVVGDNRGIVPLPRYLVKKNQIIEKIVYLFDDHNPSLSE